MNHFLLLEKNGIIVLFNNFCRQNTADVILNKFAMLITDIARPVKMEYENRIEQIYEGDVYPVNFIEVEKTLNVINRRVSNLTLGQIQETVKREDLFKVSFSQLSLLS